MPASEPSVATPSVGSGEYIRVAEAKARYFGGAMSLRWWYRQVERGTLPHYRAGGSVLLRPADIEAFVAGQLRVGQPPPDELSAPTMCHSPARSAPLPGGLRFFKS